MFHVKHLAFWLTFIKIIYGSSRLKALYICYNATKGGIYMDLSAVYLSSVALTILLVLIIGYHASKSIHSASAYSVNGRKSSSVFIAGSLLGTSIGGGATVGTAQMAFSFGLPAFWFTLGTGLAFLIMALFYAKKLRNTPMETVPEFLASVYGRKIKTPASLISSLGILFSAVASTLPGIFLLSLLFHISLYESVILLILLVSLYTFFGGMKTAAVGGMIKTVLLYMTLFFAGYMAFSSLSLSDASLPSHFFSLWSRGIDVAFADLLSLITGIICTQTYVQCVFSSKSPTAAMVGCFLAALIVIPVGLPSVAIGMYMHVYHPDAPGILILPLFLSTEIHPLIGGVATGSILLALIGSIGGLSLGVGTMISKDVIAPLFSVTKDKTLLLLHRLAVVVVMILAGAIAILYHDSQILFWNYASLALRGAAFLIPFTAALFTPSLFRPSFVILSLWVGAAAGLLTLFLPGEYNPFFVSLITSMLFLLPGLFKK